MQLEIKLHKAQRHILDNRKRFNVIRCGRRFGKSHLLYSLALEKMVEVPYAKVLYTAPTYSDTINRYKECSEYFRAAFGKQAKIKEGYIELNGSFLQFYGLHNYDSIRGNKYHRFLGDEWAISKNAKNAWSQVIQPTLMDYRGDVYWASTPKKDTHFEELANNETFTQFHFTSYDGLISKSEIDLLCEQLPRNIVQQEIFAEFVTLDGELFKQKDVRYDTFDCDFYIMAVDLAVSLKEKGDFVAIAVIGIKTENDGTRKYLVKNVLQAKKTFREQINWIIETYNVYRPTQKLLGVAIETVGYQQVMAQELIWQSDLNVLEVFPFRDKVTRAQSLQARYEMGLVYHEHHLTDSDFEKQLFNFNGKDGHDDMVDALVHAYNSQQLFGSTNVY